MADKNSNLNEENTEIGNESKTNEENTVIGNESKTNEEKYEIEKESKTNEEYNNETEFKERKSEANEKPQEVEIKVLLRNIIYLMRDKIRKENSENKEQLQINESLKNKIEDIEYRCQKVEQEKKNIQEECNDKDKTIIELNQKLNSTEDKLEKLVDNIENERKVKNSLNEKIKKLNQEIEALKNDNQQIIANLQEIESELKSDDQFKAEDLTKKIDFKERSKAESKAEIEFSKNNMVKSEKENYELFETIQTRDLEINDRIENCYEKICSELNELKNSIAECFSRLNQKQDEKSLLDDFMSQNDRCDRQSMFETILKEINDLKNSIKIYELSSKIPPSVQRNSIAVRFDSLIPIYDDSLLQNLDPEAFKSYHTPEWFCLTFIDLLKKKILQSSSIKEILKILIKIIKICDERSLDLVENILNQLNNFDLVAKYEIVSQVMIRDPNRKRRMMNIFIKDLESLVLNTTAEELDQNFQQNNPELYQKIRIILEMSNYSVLDMIDIDTINTLKRSWNYPRTIIRQSIFLFQ